MVSSSPPIIHIPPSLGLQLLEPSQAAAFPGISADAIEIAREHGASAFALNASHRPGRSEISRLSSIRAVTTLADVRAETATLLPRLSNMSGQ
jgi:hypothetical protein